ncbi:hypothetical protein [Clostridium tertium]
MIIYTTKFKEGKQQIKVQEVKLDNNQRRYLLVYDNGLPKQL